MKNNLEAKSGIYKITINDYYVYIGQSNRLRYRINIHIKNLKDNKHCNKKFQNVFNKYPNTIKFEVVEYCDVNMLDDKLNLFLNSSLSFFLFSSIDFRSFIIFSFSFFSLINDHKPYPILLHI